jgi:hypothetical protein
VTRWSRAYAQVLVPIVLLLLIFQRHSTVVAKPTQGLIRSVPLAARVEVVVVNVFRGHPAAASTVAFEHAADFLTERAWQTNGERVRAYVTPTDGIFTARSAVCG